MKRFLVLISCLILISVSGCASFEPSKEVIGKVCDTCTAVADDVEALRAFAIENWHRVPETINVRGKSFPLKERLIWLDTKREEIAAVCAYSCDIKNAVDKAKLSGKPVDWNQALGLVLQTVELAAKVRSSR